jgi:predicted nucleic acid-binding protein
MTLVDANVLLDVATDDPKWARWSIRQLDAAAMRGLVVINAIVYAEFSIGYTRIEAVDRALVGGGLELVEIPRAALFLAGKVFQRYRAHGGSRTGVLPDFFYRRPCSCGAIAFVDPRSKPLPKLFLWYCSHHAGH